MAVFLGSGLGRGFMALGLGAALVGLPLAGTAQVSVPENIPLNILPVKSKVKKSHSRAVHDVTGTAGKGINPMGSGDTLPAATVAVPQKMMLTATRSETSVSADIAGSLAVVAQPSIPALSKVQSETQEEKQARLRAATFCANVSDAASANNLRWQAERIAELDVKLMQRVAELEAKRAEYQAIYDKHEEARRLAADAVIAIFGKMKPESASQQLAAMDETTAAAIIGRLNPRSAGTILNEMEATKASRITEVMSRTKSTSNKDISREQP